MSRFTIFGLMTHLGDGIFSPDISFPGSEIYYFGANGEIGRLEWYVFVTVGDGVILDIQAIDDTASYFGYNILQNLCRIPPIPSINYKLSVIDHIRKNFATRGVETVGCWETTTKLFLEEADIQTLKLAIADFHKGL